MPSRTHEGSTLSENLGSVEALREFRSVAAGRKPERDGPFGPPPPAKTKGPPERKKRARELRSSRDRTDPPPESPATASESPSRAASPVSRAKALLLTENVTVPLSTALRDRSEDLARLLNRSRKVRKERITRNTIIRVALQHFLDTFTLEPEQSVDGEAELLDLLRSKRRQTTPPEAS